MSEGEASKTVVAMNRNLLILNLLLAGWVSFAIYTRHGFFVEFFHGMSLQLPGITKLFMWAGFPLVPPAILLTALGTYLVQRQRPQSSVKVQAVCLVATVFVWKYALKAALAPILQLIGNLS